MSSDFRPDHEHLPDVTDRDLAIMPLEKAETIPASWYVDPRIHEFEMEMVHARSWNGVGHLSRVQNPGDQIVASVAGNPILVVRGDDNQLRAFFNVCRHRGGPLALEDGRSRVLQCQYHGWTYLLDGSLRGTPRFNRVDLFDRKDYGLVPVQLDTWEGLIFVSICPADIKLEALLGGLAERISPIRLDTKKFFRRATYDIRCNWKIYIDNYLEGYHLPYVHPELCKTLDYSEYVTETFEHYSLQHSPIVNGGTLYGSAEGHAFYYYIWPNFMLNILPGRLQTNLVLPVASDRCQVIFEYYYDDLNSEDRRDAAEEDIITSDKIQKEDMEICEHVQVGVASRGYSKGRFSVESEKAVYHFQSLLKLAYRGALETGNAAAVRDPAPQR